MYFATSFRRFLNQLRRLLGRAPRPKYAVKPAPKSPAPGSVKPEVNALEDRTFFNEYALGGLALGVGLGAGAAALLWRPSAVRALEAAEITASPRGAADSGTAFSLTTGGWQPAGVGASESLMRDLDHYFAAAHGTDDATGDGAASSGAGHGDGGAATGPAGDGNAAQGGGTAAGAAPDTGANPPGAVGLDLGRNPSRDVSEALGGASTPASAAPAASSAGGATAGNLGAADIGAAGRAGAGSTITPAPVPGTTPLAGPALTNAGPAAAPFTVLPGVSGTNPASTPAANTPPANGGGPAAPSVQQAAQLPLSFEVNQGQTDPSVQFLAHAGGYTLFLTGPDATLALAPAAGTSAPTSDVVQLHFVGANPHAQVTGAQPLPGVVNYILGNDPQQWHQGVPTYAQAVVNDLYPGIDLVYHGTRDQVEYDWVVAPGADPGQIKLQVQGASHVAVDASGDLVATLPGGGTLTQHTPALFQDAGGARQAVSGGFTDDGQQVGLAVGAYDRGRPLVIDPTLSYSTYLGGSGNDVAYGVALDFQGNLYLTGSTTSTNFPTHSANHTVNRGGTDAFITALNPSGSALVYSTYVGGSGTDIAHAIAINGTANPTVVGETTSTDFPTDIAYQSTNAGGTDAFFITLGAGSGNFNGGSYLGGSGNDVAYAVAIDSSSQIYIAGQTFSSDFPTQSAVQSAYGGAGDAFVARFGGSTLQFSTYLGGSAADAAYGLAVESNLTAGTSSPYVTGSTLSANFPTTSGAYQTAAPGNGDAFVTKLTGGTSFAYSTYLGGASGSDTGYAVAVDSSGDAYVAGSTGSTNFPTASAFQAANAGGTDAFVSELNSSGSGLTYSSYLGGSGNDVARGIALDGSNNAYVVGSTASTDFPVGPAAVQSTNAGGGDAFLAEVSAAGTPLMYGTYLGGSGADDAYGVALDSSGNAYVAGSTASTNFPTASAYQSGGGGGTDAFLGKVTSLPTSYATLTTTASTATTNQGSGTPGVFTLSRSGGDTTSPLTVSFTLGGTAVNGTDYSTLPTSVTFGANVTSTTLQVSALLTTGHGPKTVVLTLGSGLGYTSASGMNTATVTIYDPLPASTPPDLGGFVVLGQGDGLPGANLGGCATCGSPVRALDGSLNVTSSDLPASAVGGFGQDVSWSNAPGYAGGANGTGVVDNSMPSVIEVNGGTNSLAVVTGGNSAEYFDWNGMSYVPRFYSQDTLTHNTASGTYTLADSSGQQFTFHDFGASLPAAEQGAFQSRTDRGGNLVQVTAHNAAGQVTEVQSTQTVGLSTYTDSYVYSYVATGADAGLVQSVLFRRQVNGGAWTNVRQVVYAYYTTGDSFGNVGDLKTITSEDGSGNVLDTQYFRYYTGESGGYVHGLKYSFGAASYARLVTAVGTPFSATDAQVAPYADDYVQYDGQHRVTQLVVQGAGGPSTGGLGTFSYTYTTSSNTADPNRWATKTTETLPDGNQNIVYTNAYGQQMLKVYHDTVSGLNWEWFDKYDSSGRRTLHAEPSAVTGYDDTKADLLNSQSGNYQYLADGAGLVTTFAYATSTTATGGTAGDVAGYLQSTSIQQGEFGTAVKQSSQQYVSQTGGGATVYPVANTTVYRNTNGTGGETTGYAYTYFAGSVQVQSMTTTLPTVTAAENGPGTADQSVTDFDAYGRATWAKDGDGYLTYTAYDPATGAVVKTITDVDTTRTADFTGLPMGWSTPAGGGLHLITTYQVDALGRTTVRTDPTGTVTYTVYNDPAHETLTYAGWNSSTGAPTGPTQVTREDRANSYTETFTMSAAPHLTGGAPDGTEAVGGLQTLSRSYVSAGGQVTATDDYFNLSGLTYTTAVMGTAGTNFYQTVYGYDSRGRQNRVVRPTGTIDRTVYDGLSRVVSAWTGTNDAGATDGDPTGGGATGNNMVKLTADVYDAGGVGDGNLTQVTAFPNDGSANRVTQQFFDWRDRLVATKGGVQATEAATVHRPVVYNDYDNLNEVIDVSQYDGDGVTLATSGGVPQKPSSALLRAYTVSNFDEQQRVYLRQVYSVDPSTGAVSTNSLNTNTYYNHRGLVIATSAPGGVWAKQVYDGAGRVTVTYTTDGATGTTWANAGSVASDNVLEQVENAYDANGNVILVTTRQRFHDETTTGALGNPTTAPKARVSYVAYYYDLADRLTATVDVGTNGGTAYTRPSTVPAASDTVLVTSQSYNAAGWVQDVVDPRGIDQHTYYDNLGRTLRTVSAYTPNTSGAAVNQTVVYTYDGDNHTLTVTTSQDPNVNLLLSQNQAVPATGVQTTQYVYGVATSAIHSNDLLATIQWPDPTTGQPSTSSTQNENLNPNALGETTTYTDRNGTTHTYTRDVLGRVTSDTITTLGAGVDGSVRRIDTAYDTQGNPYLITSYADTAGTNVVNQVQRSFNGLAQLTNDYQAHGGAVNTSTTPQVQYGYNVMAGGANNSRLVSMTYPNGKALMFNYAAGLDSAISRLTSISDSTGTLAAFTYLGFSTVVQQADGPTTLTYIGSGTGDAGDKYTGLDRFGRVAEQKWTVTAGTTDDFTYTFDRDGNRLTRNNVLNVSFNESYAYDTLNQLTSFTRGSGLGAHTQTFTTDSQGNFSNVTTDSVPQLRTTNQQNEITVAGTSPLSYDNNGNLTKDQAGNTLVWDAWNRLVAYKNSSGTTLIAYSYDGLGRRITENRSGTVTDLYYSAAGQVVEERVSGTAKYQYVWSPVYVNALVLRDDVSAGTRLYVQQDANWNVTALVDSSGTVQERDAYDPYGAVTYLTPTWGSRSGSSVNWVYGFQGGRYEPITLFVHFGGITGPGRDFSTALQRWASVDPERVGTNFYVGMGDNPANGVDPTGYDVWIEGPSQNEPAGHISLNVGDPLGKYESYSFGASGVSLRSLGLEGRIYKDESRGGEIDADHYLKTTPEFDKELIARLDELIQSGSDPGPYRLGNRSCRTWVFSQFEDIENALKQRGEYNKTTPPARNPASWWGWIGNTGSTTVGVGVVVFFFNPPAGLIIAAFGVGVALGNFSSNGQPQGQANGGNIGLAQALVPPLLQPFVVGAIQNYQPQSLLPRLKDAIAPIMGQGEDGEVPTLPPVRIIGKRPKKE